MPLVVNGVLYTSTPLNLVFALDAVTGREQQVLDEAFK
jgi:glucose dehydrogenase